ncbi:hypothetical protein ACHAXH_008418 [Discostella pseudostelligera]
MMHHSFSMMELVLLLALVPASVLGQDTQSPTLPPVAQVSTPQPSSCEGQQWYFDSNLNACARDTGYSAETFYSSFNECCSARASLFDVGCTIYDGCNSVQPSKPPTVAPITAEPSPAPTDIITDEPTPKPSLDPTAGVEAVVTPEPTPAVTSEPTDAPVPMTTTSDATTEPTPAVTSEPTDAPVPMTTTSDATTGTPTIATDDAETLSPAPVGKLVSPSGKPSTVDWDALPGKPWTTAPSGSLRPTA